MVSVLFYFAVLKPVQQLPYVLNPLVGYDGTTFIRGIFPQNLKGTFPFISSSLFNTNFWGVQLEKTRLLSFVQAMHLFQLTDLVIMAVLITLFINKKLTIRKELWLPLCIAAALVGQVLYLSLTYQAFSYTSSTNLWTYVSDARTFLFPMLLLQLLLFSFLFTVKKAKAVTILLLLIILFEVVHGFYFSVKSAVNSSEVMRNKSGSGAIKKITNILKVQGEKQKTGLITSDNILRRYALVNNLPAYTFSAYQKYVPGATPVKIFIIATHAQETALLKKFMGQHLISMDTIQPFVLHTFTIR
jgi:hypothetical protein